jgi:hypothetical protein
MRQPARDDNAGLVRRSVDVRVSHNSAVVYNIGEIELGGW